MTEEPGQGLTRQQFDAVIRRAAEIASSDHEAREVSLSEAEVVRIGREVGLEEHHIRTALSEVRAGVSDNHVLRWVFGPARVRGARVVPGDPEELSALLDEFFGEALLLERVRRGPRSLQFRKAEGFASQMARAFNFRSRKSQLTSARTVEVTLESGPALVGPEAQSGVSEVQSGVTGAHRRTLVEIRVDPGQRGDHLVGALALGSGIALAAGGSSIAFATLALGMPILIAAVGGVALGSVALGAVTYAFGSEHRKLIAAAEAEVEGILDRLELEESLDDPPSWRRWMRRQLGGLAGELTQVSRGMGGGTRS